MKKISRNRKAALVLSVMSAICFVVAFSDAPKTFAKYAIGASGTMTTEVAKPLLVIEVTSPSSTLDPENSTDIDFSVKNFSSSSSTSEVSLEYYLSFSNALSNLPVTYSLKNNDSNETIALDSNNKTSIATSLPISQTTHHYTLTIAWDQNGDKSSSLANLTDTLIITADVKQSFRSGS